MEAYEVGASTLKCSSRSDLIPGMTRSFFFLIASLLSLTLTGSQVLKPECFVSTLHPAKVTRVQFV